MDATSTPVGTGFFADNNGQELKILRLHQAAKELMKQRTQRVPHCEMPQHMNKRRVNRSIKTKKGLTVVTVNP